MRRFLLFLFLSTSGLLPAQNGTTLVSMPTFFNPVVLRFKNCIAADNNGKIWIGLRDNGIIVWDGMLWDYFDLNNGLSDYNVHCIDFDPNGDAWAGTDTGGVCVYNGFTWTPFSTWNSPLPGRKVLCTKRYNNLRWFGTNRGLASYDGTNWTIYNVQNSPLPGDTVNEIAFTASGELLAATSRGLIRFNGTTWSSSWTVAAGVEHVYVHGDGTEWAVTQGQLYKNTSAGFTVPDQLVDPPTPFLNNGVGMIGEGPSGGVCFAAKLGSLNETDQDRIRTYYPVGLVTNASRSYALFSRDNNGVFWFVNDYSIFITEPAIALLRFDPQLYNGLGEGFTFDNTKNLNVNQVNAKVLNRGDMHWDAANACYNVPAGGAASTVFCSGLWIGGLDSGGALHEAAMTYRQNGADFFPGPLDPQTAECDTATAEHYDRIWKLNAYQVSEFQWQFANGNVQNGTYTPPADLRDWPATGNYGVTEPLAPFVDVNGNGIYDPLTGGDYPVIRGDQELFYVFNDALAAHTETDAPALGVEVQAHAYAYVCTHANDSTRALNYTTFYSYDIINRSSQDYSNVALGLFQDVDLGFWQDDLVGCYPPANAGFIYNGDAYDEPAPNVACYNYYVPVQSIAVLDGPLAPPNDSIDNDNDGVTDEPGEKILLSRFVSHLTASTGSYPYSNSQESTDYYGYLTGHWQDSTWITYGADGHTGPTPTAYMYPALPSDTGWSEITAAHVPGDRMMLSVTGGFDLAAGDTAHYTFALVTTFDSLNAWNSPAYYQRMLFDLQQVQQWYAANAFPSCMPLFDGIMETTASPVALQLFPNPASDQLTIVYAAQTQNAVMEIFSMEGKRIFAGSWMNHTSLSVPVETLPPGVYFVRIVDGATIVSAKFVKR